MSCRCTRWFVALLLTCGLIGCGGGGIQEGMPDDLEQAEAEFEADFRGTQEAQGDEMLGPQAP
ncbi:hypothetical protein BH23PLA1_BH23PLA1_37830 [soil metagenome]